MCVDINNINEIITVLLRKLAENQLPEGEFKTFAKNKNGQKFYIGESPFVTAHIAYLLHGSDNDICADIVDNSILFLENIDDSGKRVYKFWYGKVQGTEFPELPYDMDDTAVVNTALFLAGKICIDKSIVTSNINSEGFYYTWLRFSFKNLFRHFKLFKTQLKSLNIFFSSSHSGSMAKYSDSEIIVRCNIYLFMSIAGKDILKIADNFFPATKEEVENELKKSLHYMHAPVYYFTLAKFQKHSNYFNNLRVGEFENGIRIAIENERSKPNISVPDLTALYLSLSFFERLKSDDISNFFDEIHVADLYEQEFYFCVGNKHYDNYHVYYSTDFYYALMVRLLSDFKKIQN